MAEVRDQLIDGSTVPWDFVAGSEQEHRARSIAAQSRQAPTIRPATVTPAQADQRRLIAAGRWRR